MARWHGRCPGELTRAQLRVAARVAEGAEDRTIASEFNISLQTVKNHLQSAYAELGMRNRTQLAVWYVTRFRR